MSAALDFYKFATLKRAAEVTGYSVGALEKKIENGVFAEGIHYVIAPDNRRHINLKELERWIESNH